MDLEHPAISRTQKEGYPDGTGKPLNNNIVSCDYSREEEETQVNEEFIDFIEQYKELREKAEEIGVIYFSPVLNQMQVFKIDDFLTHTKGFDVEISKRGDDEYPFEATAIIDDVEIMIILTCEQKNELEELMNE